MQRKSGLGISMMTLVRVIPLPIFVLISLGIFIALLGYAAHAYKKNRDVFLLCIVASFAGPIAIFSRCVYDYFSIDSVISKLSFYICVVFIIALLIVLCRVIWKRYRRGYIQGKDKAVMFVGFGFIFLAVIGFLMIFLLMKLGI